MASSAHTTTALGAIALQACLNEIDPGHFAPLSTPPGVIATGDASGGTVTIDFGTGTRVNNATVSGAVVANYGVSGDSVTITVTFSGLAARTTPAGSMGITGSLTVTATLNDTSSISGALSGAVTTTASSNITVLTPNLAFAIDGTPITGDVGIDGTMGADSSAHGSWTATLTGIHATVSQSSRDIRSGTLAMQHDEYLSYTVTMQFTAPNTGTLDVSPSGATKIFTL